MDSPDASNRNEHGWRSFSDQSLVTAVARFHEPALEEIYRRHSMPVFALASRIVGDRTTAQDVVQEVFLRLWNEPEKYDAGRGSLRTFLLTTTHGRSVDLLRSNAARRRRETSDANQMEVAVDDLEREVLDLATAEYVKEAFRKLPETEQAALEMTYFQGFSYVEAARRLGQPEGTIKSRIRSGLKRLRDLLPAAVEDER